ncbi:hypothetical protein E1211_24140 [Micromonospora sp. 15K316]|uniref:hypothetical protein n=1 Tax=Micromonospora sp. 15K316 TaxID=2530376 RepID=UPI001052F715|nr:hypothetical protein [Micromonospora sp. 15K316]TDC30477.1 hypothetical protein E1211_24140 [Micromonospora sp. 15K316]
MPTVRDSNPSLRRLLLGGLATLLGVTVLTPPASASPEPPVPTGPGAEAARAAGTAERTGRRVEVVSARTEFTQVFAKPSGGFVAESAVVPQRVRRPDGSWAEVDLTLRRDAAGALRPSVSPADVRFSAGGTGPAAALRNGGKSLTLSWPSALPAPRLSGETATYPDVLPGVDLVLRATHTGFTHVLAVKTPQAATNPALREIRFDLGGDVRVERNADGSLRALAGTTEVARSGSAEMWDSTAVPSTVRSSATGPGAAARTAAVGTAINAAGDLVLRPTAALLDPAKATFPVYIDPAWSVTRSRWAYATSNNSTNSDLTAARVGKDSTTGVTYRSYFEFPIIALHGTQVASGYVQMKLDHSWSCGNTPTYLYQAAGSLTSVPRLPWEAQPALTARTSANSHANEGAGCADSPQPDMTVNFTGGSVVAGLRSAVSSGWSTVTYALCACSDASGTNEGQLDRWKRFYPGDARLVVDYDTPSGQPAGLRAGGQACVAGERAVVATAPTLSAAYPDSDVGQTLQTAYELLEIPASGSYDSNTPRLTPPTGGAVSAGARYTTGPVTGLSGGKAYAWRTRASSSYTTGPWSQWCEFTLDDSPPAVAVDAITGPLPPGEFYTFKLRSPDPDVVTFRYGWTSPPTEEAEAGTTLGYPGKTASVTLTTPDAGTHTLYVAAVDSAGNVGDGSVVVQVSPPAAG